MLAVKVEGAKKKLTETEFEYCRALTLLIFSKTGYKILILVLIISPSVISV